MYRIRTAGGWLYRSRWFGRWMSTRHARMAARLPYGPARELAAEHGGWLVPD